MRGAVIVTPCLQVFLGPSSYGVALTVPRFFASVKNYKITNFFSFQSTANENNIITKYS